MTQTPTQAQDPVRGEGRGKGNGKGKEKGKGKRKGKRKGNGKRLLQPQAGLIRARARADPRVPKPHVLKQNKRKKERNRVSVSFFFLLTLLDSKSYSTTAEEGA